MITMKRVIVNLLLIIILSSFVMSGSEISTNFVRGSDEGNIERYIPKGSLWNNYGSYIIGVLVVLIIVFVVLKIKTKKKSKRVHKRKSKRARKRKSKKVVKKIKKK